MANTRNVNAYLHFNGNCREVMEFYKQCLGGDLNIMTAEGTPMAENVPADSLQKVMHAGLTGPGWAILASDWMSPNPYVPGNNFSVMIAPASEEEANTVFNNLAAGGTVMMALEPTFWGAIFGMVKDKYGIDWMVNFQKDQS